MAVLDAEVFDVDVGVADEGQLGAATLFEVDEDLFVFFPQALHDHGVHGDAQGHGAFVGLLFHDFDDAALDADAHGEGREDFSPAVAVGAVGEVRGSEAFLHALAGHFDESQGGHGQDVGAGLVLLEGFLEGFVEDLLVFAGLHVDEVDDDQPADVPQPQLPGDFDGGLDVDFEDAVFLGLPALVAAGVDVDGDESLGFVEVQIRAGLEPNLAAVDVVELPFGVEVLEDGRGALVEFDFVAGGAGDAQGHVADAVVGLAVVDDDAVDVTGEAGADDALDEVGLAVEQAWGGLVLDAVLDLLPDVGQSAPIAREGRRRAPPSVAPPTSRAGRGFFHTVENFSILWKIRAKHASIVWKSARNLLPLCGRFSETRFHCVEKLPKPSSIVWKPPPSPPGFPFTPYRLRKPLVNP